MSKKDKRMLDAGYSMPDEDKPVIDEKPSIPEEPGKIYVLVWYQCIVHDSKIIYPGDEVDKTIYRKMPPYLKQHFWEKGIEIPERTYNKLSKNLQEKFKVKK
jgi:hypothetical protein